jgi:predicted dehydrogenase
MPPSPLTRRHFLRSTTLAGAAALAAPAVLRASPGGLSPNERLNIAIIGVGGRGRAALQGFAAENIVALCDVDATPLAAAHEQHPGAETFRDYRVMLARMDQRIDAVAIMTPDHMHYPMAVAALALGKHVFVEKPLTHTIAEARELARLAAASPRLATQMGNQGRANEGHRLLKEWIDAGVLGPVREVHSWTNRPIWPQGINAPDHSQMIPVCPPHLDWDLWLGVAAERPYDPAYAPFKWRGFWDFGTGALGDMGCHILDGAFHALDLRAPRHITATSAKENEISAPTASIITFDFPARGALPPLTLKWYDGGLKPPLPDDWPTGRALPGNGTLIVGDHAKVLADTYYASVRIVPEDRMRELAPTLPPRSLPRVRGGHFAEWLDACRGGPACGSEFAYAAGLTELCLLSNLAVRAGRQLEWDAAAMQVTNFAAANQYLTKEYRPGHGV